MVDPLKRLGYVDCDGRSAERRLLLIEPVGDAIDEWKKRCCRRVMGSEAMLSGRKEEQRFKVRQQAALENLRRRRQQGDWPIGSGDVGWFPRFRDRDDHRLLPHRRNLGAVDRHVEDMCEISDCSLAKVLKM